MPRLVKIAAVQLPSQPEGKNNAEKRESNFKAAEIWLAQAGREQADIACLGETFSTLGLHLTPENLVAESSGLYDETLERLGAIAREFQMYVIAPTLVFQENRVRNAALLLDRHGALLGHYLKVHCIENERNLGIVPGDAWPTFALDFGKIGIQICHDNSFPESARCLMLNGAEIIFWPHVMGGWGGEFMDVLLRAPAIHNGVHFVPACFGCPHDRAWRPGMLIGRSSIIRPEGTIAADAGRHPGIAFATIDLERPRIAADFTRSGDYHWQIDMLNDRRPEIYREILRPTVPISPKLPEK
jgi:predicted amidohydrolase